MQTEIALSSTKSEYTGLSYALREAIPMIELLKDMKRNGFKVDSANPKVHCSLFEDNTGSPGNSPHPQLQADNQTLEHSSAPLPRLLDLRGDHHPPHRHYGTARRLLDQSGQREDLEEAP